MSERKESILPSVDNEIITKIDSKWESLNIGEFLSSPSKIYSNLIINSGAVANEKEN